MIDKDGFRPNVGIVICNRKGQVLWARRIRQNSWQFPQGGVDHGETPEAAMYRELYEELGLTKDDVNLIASTKFWLKYRLKINTFDVDSYIQRINVISLSLCRSLITAVCVSIGESRCSHSCSRGCYSSSHKRSLHSHRYSRYR